MHTAAGKAALFHEIRFHPEWRDRKAEFELIITLWLELQGIPSPPPFSFFFFLLKIIKLDEARYLSSELFHSPISKEIKSSNNFMQNLALYASGSVANLTITNNSLVFQSFNYLFFNFFFFLGERRIWVLEDSLDFLGILPLPSRVFPLAGDHISLWTSANCSSRQQLGAALLWSDVIA